MRTFSVKLAGDFVWISRRVNLHASFPTIAIPELAAHRDALDQWIQPLDSKAKPLTFRTAGAGHPEDVTLSPFYRLFDQRYNIYWRFRPAADAKVLTS
jgi:Domain of unknown function